MFETPTTKRRSFETELIHIPTGPFQMGTSDQQIDGLARNTDWAKKWQEQGRFDREQPSHTLTLPDYYVGRYPVTVGEHRAFVQAGGYQRRQFWTDAGWAWREAGGVVEPAHWGDEKWAGDDGLPVVGVSWYEAVAYWTLANLVRPLIRTQIHAGKRRWIQKNLRKSAFICVQKTKIEIRQCPVNQCPIKSVR